MGWIERLLRRPSPAPAAPRYLPGERAYCIGDVHGCADLLAELHALIERDARDFHGRCRVIYLGDYIDRGQQSREVIDLLLHRPLEGFERVHLKGNHEQALLDFLAFPGAVASWLTFGGRSTLASYGIHAPALLAEGDPARLAAELEEALPPDHRAFLEACQASWRGGDYFFVHAGIRPGVPLDQQHFEDLLWIREEFIDSARDHGVTVVHGHSITARVEFRANRIGIDTGAYDTGVLTALVLEEDRQRLLQTGPGQPG